MTKSVFLGMILAACACAAPITITSATLATMPPGSSSFTYAGLDGDGTTLTASRTGGSFSALAGGTWPGLWIGNENNSGTYTFVFNAPVLFAEFYITAMSTGAGFSEEFTGFTANSPVTVAFTNVLNTAWNGSTVSSSSSDGRFRIRLTSTGGNSLTTFSFQHNQAGSPAGSVVQEMSYERGVANGEVPEPGTFVIAGLGLGALALLRRRS